MLLRPEDRLEELTEQDVLRVDPVREYDRRRLLRQFAEWRLALVGDESDDVVAQGRPTGP